MPTLPVLLSFDWNVRLERRRPIGRAAATAVAAAVSSLPRTSDNVSYVRLKTRFFRGFSPNDLRPSVLRHSRNASCSLIAAAVSRPPLHRPRISDTINRAQGPRESYCPTADNQSQTTASWLLKQGTGPAPFLRTHNRIGRNAINWPRFAPAAARGRQSLPPCSAATFRPSKAMQVLRPARTPCPPTGSQSRRKKRRLQSDRFETGAGRIR